MEKNIVLNMEELKAGKEIEVPVRFGDDEENFQLKLSLVIKK